MQPSTNSRCSFCNKSLQHDGTHDCVTKAYALLNSLTQRQKNPDTIFNDVDNLVFQGGGMLGIGYIGVMDQLLKENPNIFKNLKRVAGTSAGSIMALYVGLNLDYSDISTLMNRSYMDLLDQALVLRVATKFGLFFSYENFTVRDVFLKAFAEMNNLLMEFLKNPTGAQQKAEEMMFDIFRYYSSKFDNFFFYTAFKYGAQSFSQMLIKWLMTILKPDQGGLLQTSGVSSMSMDGQSAFDTMLDSTITKVMTTPQKMEQTNERTTTTSEETMKMTAGVGAGMGAGTKNDMSKMLDETAAFYLQQKHHSMTHTATDASQLTGKVLHYAIGELLWFIFISQVGARGIKEELGMFSGDIVKQELIEGAIKMKFERMNMMKDYMPGMTFKQLADMKTPDGKRMITPFFVTAYNYANRRTEVFSMYHTPNVAASDAVRASMSIPIFFTPPKIRENGVPRKVYHGDGKSSEEIRYMDGGVFDNYPIWIFDDLKYCLEGIPEWMPDRKFAMQNPKTLGFRLLEKRRIDIYREPYYDEQKMMMKRVGSGAYENTFTTVMGSLMLAMVNHSMENEHIKRGDCPRTAYVDHLGINPVSFDLSMEDKQRLIDSGVNAVLEYKKRAETGFVGEGEMYH